MGKKGSVCIAIGLLLLAAALLLTLYNLWDAHRADLAAQETVASLKTLIPSWAQPPQLAQATEPPEEPSEDPSAEDPSVDSAEEPTEETAQEPTNPVPTLPGEREMPTVEVDGYRYIGVLDVPELELSLPVMEEWDYDRLKISPCRFAGNVYQDNLVICAHNYAQHFSGLKYVPIGTEIRFTDGEGTMFRYAVASFETVGPNDVERMIQGDWDLTLFTCNTSGQTRCAIRCDRIQ